MTPLRQRMIEDMQLAGYSARTQEAYVSAVRQVFDHFQCAPAQLTEEQLREYFLFLKNDKRFASASLARPLRNPASTFLQFSNCRARARCPAPISATAW